MNTINDHALITKRNSMCRRFYSAMRSTAQLRTVQAFEGAAVLGDSLGYTVELKDGTQLEVGSAHCKWCARSEALSQLGDKIEGVRDSVFDDGHGGTP